MDFAIVNITKHLIVLFVLLIVFPSLLFAQGSDDGTKRGYRFIYSKELFFNTKTEDAIALTKIFTEKVKKKNGIEDEAEIVICKNDEELIDATKTNFDFVLSTTVALVRLLKIGNVKPVLVNQTQGSYGFVYYLVTRKDKNINHLSDLKNRKLNILARSDGQTPSLWLEKILRDNKLPVKNRFFEEITFDYKPTNILLPVFFNKLDAAVITKESFDVMCELNPNIKKDLNILATSKTLLFGVLSFDTKSKNKEREKFIYDILTTMENDADGRQFLSLFSLDKIIPYKEEYLTKFMELYK
ncbi:MAG: PhnD/SsuA/transferrin family substrate-binding protein [Ignavibacteriales bacterium]|nr:PhnD/SsuA/transferrin family substrate-binding protein [Ignavibacteriales bacterium]